MFPFTAATCSPLFRAPVPTRYGWSENRSGGLFPGLLGGLFFGLTFGLFAGLAGV